MHVQVKLFATFRQYLPPNSKAGACDLEVPAGTQVLKVLSNLGVPLEKPDSVVILVNGRQADLKHTLDEGDVVSAFPAIAGGECNLRSPD